jgi:ribosomal protein S18 acetylase RimI-like enzyme
MTIMKSSNRDDLHAADIHIRRCRAEDFEDVVRLLRQLWPDKHVDAASIRMVFERAVASESQEYLCAAQDRHVIGFGSLTIKNSFWNEGFLGYIDELVVDVEYRGQGIGTKLLEQLAAVARQRGCRRIELDSAFHRKRAHQFYERHGFEARALLFSRAFEPATHC